MSEYKRLRTFKISKINLPIVSKILNKSTDYWSSALRDLIPFDSDHFIASVMIKGSYPYMDNELANDAEILLDTKQGSQLYCGEWIIYDNGDWIGQKEFHEKYPGT